MLSNTDITIKDVMLQKGKFPIIGKSGLFKEALEIMGEHRLGIISIVDDDDTLIGIITDGDIRRKLLNNQKPISAFFVDDAIDHAIIKPIVVNKNDKLLKALRIMEEKKVWDLPVIDYTNKLVGLLHLHQVIQILTGDASDI